MEVEERKVDPYIPFYNEAPEDIINLEDLETLCFRRVACLKIVELESEAFDDFEMIHKRIKDKFKKQDIKLDLFHTRDDAKITEDNISHFMLRLAYCRTDEYRRWLTQQESRLFKHVLYEQTNKDQARLRTILKEKEIKFEKIGDDEWKNLRTKITWKRTNEIDYKQFALIEGKLNSANPDERESAKATFDKLRAADNNLKNNYFKFRWEDSKHLVGLMQCFCHKGMVYLHSSQLFTIIAEEFKKELSSVLMY